MLHRLVAIQNKNENLNISEPIQVLQVFKFIGEFNWF